MFSFTDSFLRRETWIENLDIGKKEIFVSVISMLTVYTWIMKSKRE